MRLKMDADTFGVWIVVAAFGGMVVGALATAGVIFGMISVGVG